MPHTSYTTFIELLHRYEGACIFPTESDALHAAADTLLFDATADAETLTGAVAALKRISESGRLSVETTQRLQEALDAITPVRADEPALAA